MKENLPKRPSARIAMYYKAITEARLAGYTWGEIASTLGMHPKTVSRSFAVAKKAIEAGRLRAGDLPLPGITVKQEKQEKPKLNPINPNPQSSGKPKPQTTLDIPGAIVINPRGDKS